MKKQIEITKAATSRGTDYAYLWSRTIFIIETFRRFNLISEFLFKIAKTELNKIDNIHCLEGAMYSKQLGVAGTTDCIAEFDGELAVIDFKTSKKPKPREWIENYFVQAMFYGMASL
jgi:ATP-dependent exoDNAse (exonuclease V) beta subunit